MEQERAIFSRRSMEDDLRIEGSDALDLLHRIAASEVRTLGVGQAAAWVFTDDKGRVVDGPLVVRQREDSFLFLCGRTRGPVLAQWLERYVITEDVSISNSSIPSVALVGIEAVRLAESIDGLSLLYGTETVGLAQGSARTLDQLVVAGLGEVDDAELQAMAVHTGVIRSGPGLAAGVNPLELGWKERVSFTKGCYIGQEVVARLDTYDKVKRRAVVIALNFGEAIAPGTAVRGQGKKMGVVLEWAPAPDTARATAVVDREIEVGAEIEVEGHGPALLERIIPNDEP